MHIEIIIERSHVKSNKVNSGELEALDHGTVRGGERVADSRLLLVLALAGIAIGIVCVSA